MSAEQPISVRDVYARVAEIGMTAIRRPLPKTQLQGYIELIRRAYDVAGLDPNSKPTALRPGVKDEDDEFQLFMKSTKYSGDLHHIKFIAASSGLKEIVYGEVIAESSGLDMKNEAAQRVNGHHMAYFPLTKNTNGSLAVVTGFIEDNMQRFEPVPALLIPSTL